MWLWQTTGVKADTIDAYGAGVLAHWKVHLGRDAVLHGGLHTVLLRQLRVLDIAPRLVRKAATPAVLLALAAPALTCPPVVRCAILFGFFFLLRVGEYAVSGKTQGWQARILKFADVAVAAERVSITLGARKNNPSKYPSTFARQSATDKRACLVDAWRVYVLTRPAACASPFAFVWPDGSPLTAAQVGLWLKRAAALAGLVPAHFSPHSLRIGGATAFYRLGFPIEWIMQQGFWKSLAAVLVYCRVDAADSAWCTDAMLGDLACVFGRAPGAGFGGPTSPVVMREMAQAAKPRAAGFSALFAEDMADDAEAGA